MTSSIPDTSVSTWTTLNRVGIATTGITAAGAVALIILGYLKLNVFLLPGFSAGGVSLAAGLGTMTSYAIQSCASETPKQPITKRLPPLKETPSPLPLPKPVNLTSAVIDTIPARALTLTLVKAHGDRALLYDPKELTETLRHLLWGKPLEKGQTVEFFPNEGTEFKFTIGGDFQYETCLQVAHDTELRVLNPVLSPKSIISLDSTLMIDKAILTFDLISSQSELPLDDLSCSLEQQVKKAKDDLCIVRKSPLAVLPQNIFWELNEEICFEHKGTKYTARLSQIADAHGSQFSYARTRFGVASPKQIVLR